MSNGGFWSKWGQFAIVVAGLLVTIGWFQFQIEHNDERLDDRRDRILQLERDSAVAKSQMSTMMLRITENEREVQRTRQLEQNDSVLRTQLTEVIRRLGRIDARLDRLVGKRRIGPRP